MRIISRKKLKELWIKHSGVEQSLKSWFSEVSDEKWTCAADIKKNYPSAGILSNNRVVFNIKGNKYRLIVMVNYKFKIVLIRFICTHSKYNRINAKTI